MRHDFADAVKINPITNVVTIPYNIETSTGSVTSTREVINTRLGQKILQGQLSGLAARYFDVYALIIPWRVRFEIRDRSDDTP
jgi:hypothetical protein